MATQRTSMNAPHRYTMTIAGRAVDGDGAIEVVNPASGHPFALAPDCTRAQLDEAVEAAQAAFPAWRDTPFADRAALLRRAAATVRDHAATLAALFTQEQGRPAAMARQEIDGAAAWIEAIAALTLPDRVEDLNGQRIETRHVPLGVVAAIVPWNFPVALAMWKVAPALLAGNTMVLKPSPFTPLCMLEIGALLRDVLPPGVLNIVSGGDDLGPWMTSHPGFAKISFTGSTATGRRVMESAARDLKRLTLELGGNDAAIVLPDADLDAVAQKIFFGAFYNTAQICVATKRLYVHESIYDDLRDRLVAIGRATAMGDGTDPATVLGPIQNRPQFERVQAMLDEARRDGLTLIECGTAPEQGYFIPVTIVDNPPESAAVVQKEAFGPILPMLKFRDIDEVIGRANASDYGLAGSVWSRDVDAAVAVARRIETGTVWINQALVLAPQKPFSGRKQSGFGVENGVEGLLEYTAFQTIYVPSAGAA